MKYPVSKNKNNTQIILISFALLQVLKCGMCGIIGKQVKHSLRFVCLWVCISPFLLMWKLYHTM